MILNVDGASSGKIYRGAGMVSGNGSSIYRQRHFRADGKSSRRRIDGDKKRLLRSRRGILFGDNFPESRKRYNLRKGGKSLRILRSSRKRQYTAKTAKSCGKAVAERNRVFVQGVRRC